MADSSFTVAWRAIQRRLEQNGDGVFLLVKVPGVKVSPDELVDVVEAAIQRANAALETPDGLHVVAAFGAMPTAKGPMVNLDSVDSDERNQQWLRVFAHTMAAAGYTGEVTAAPQAHFPRHVADGYFVQPRLTAYLAYTTTTPLPEVGLPGWKVADNITEDICRDAVAWGSFPGAEVYLGEGVTQIKIGTPHVADLLAAAIRRSLQARVSYIGAKPTRSRIVSLATNGEVCYQIGGEGRHWSEDLDAVRHPLLRAPEALDLAYLRRRLGFGEGSLDLQGDPYTTKDIEPWLVFYNRHLWPDYVPDPHAIQVLTKFHLDKATDLSGWDIESLAGDRYLVQARDLAPWFDTDAPDAEVVDAARADFGAMILTKDVIEADPDGWLPGRFPNGR